MPIYLFNQFFTQEFNITNRVFKFSDTSLYSTTTFLILIGELNRRLGVIFLNTEKQSEGFSRRAVGSKYITGELIPKCYVEGDDLYLDITNAVNSSSISIYGFNASKWERIESLSFDPSGMTEIELSEW